MRYVKCFRPLVRLVEVNARLTSALEAQLRDLRRRSYAARTLAMYLRARSFVLCQKPAAWSTKSAAALAPEQPVEMVEAAGIEPASKGCDQ